MHRLSESDPVHRLSDGTSTLQACAPQGHPALPVYAAGLGTRRDTLLGTHLGDTAAPRTPCLSALLCSAPPASCRAAAPVMSGVEARPGAQDPARRTPPPPSSHSSHSLQGWLPVSVTQAELGHVTAPTPQVLHHTAAAATGASLLPVSQPQLPAGACSVGGQPSAPQVEVPETKALFQSGTERCAKAEEPWWPAPGQGG